jgi:hypothetical protein
MKKNVLSLIAPMLMTFSPWRRPQFCLDITESIEEDCDANVPGLLDEVYLIPEEDITAFGALTSGTPTYKDNYTIDAPHTLASTKKWIKVDLAENSAKFSFEGPKKRSGNFMPKIEGTIPGVSDQSVGLANNFARRRCFAIGINRAKNTYYHIGYDGYPASFNVTGDTDTAEGASAGVKFEITATTPYLYLWKPANTLTVY